jgi:hypothetical protein
LFFLGEVTVRFFSISCILPAGSLKTPYRRKKLYSSVSLPLDYINGHFADLQCVGDLLRFGIDVPGKNDGELQPGNVPHRFVVAVFEHKVGILLMTH